MSEVEIVKGKGLREQVNLLVEEQYAEAFANRIVERQLELWNTVLSHLLSLKEQREALSNDLRVASEAFRGLKESVDVLVEQSRNEFAARQESRSELAESLKRLNEYMANWV